MHTLLISVISAQVSSIQGCDYVRDRNEMIELELKGQSRGSICNAIIDQPFADVFYYEMSIELFQAYSSSSSRYGFPGIMFNVQDGEGSLNNKKLSKFESSKSYDFAFLRYFIYLLIYIKLK